jgi:DNA-binding transcriptional LysR family regulator
MDTLVSMKVFRGVVDAGSFVGAARGLDISTAMASKHVAHLESHLGARLLNRSSRHLSLTDAGRVYFEQCRDMLDGLEEAEAAVGQAAAAPRGVLKLTAPVWFANARVARMFADYQARYPEVVLDVNLNDRVVDLVEEGFDLALRVTVNPGSALIARPLLALRFRMVASAAYVAARGRPAKPQDLAGHATIGYAYSPYGDQWPLEGPEGAQTAHIVPAIRSNSTMLAYEAVLAGMGIAPLPPWLVQEDLEAGRLVELLPDFRPPSATVYAVYTSRRYLSPKVRTFVDFLADHCAISSQDGDCTGESKVPGPVSTTFA